jgi:hypothetical protein
MILYDMLSYDMFGGSKDGWVVEMLLFFGGVTEGDGQVGSLGGVWKDLRGHPKMPRIERWCLILWGWTIATTI